MLSLDATVQRIGSLSEAAQQQLPFALSLALNQTALDVQLAQRLHNDREFTIRAQTFMERLVKISRSDRADKRNLVARVRIQGPESARRRGQDPAAVLTRHELGGTRTAPDPTRPFFVPADALRPSPRVVIPRQMFPAKLGLADRMGRQGAVVPGKRGNVKRIKGASGQRERRAFFVLHSDDGSGRPLGIFEREGKDDIKPLWIFTARVTIRPRLNFFATAEEVVRRRFPPNLAAAFTRAMRTARPR